MCAALLVGCAQPARVSDSLSLKDGAEAEDWLSTEPNLLQKYEFMKALAQVPAKGGQQRPVADTN
jgi:hypothetical protein